jgi:hypothetical protein
LLGRDEVFEIFVVIFGHQRADLCNVLSPFRSCLRRYVHDRTSIRHARERAKGQPAQAEEIHTENLRLRSRARRQSRRVDQNMQVVGQGGHRLVAIEIVLNPFVSGVAGIAKV